MKNIIMSYFLIFLIFMTGSCIKKKDTLSLNIIPVATTVGNYNVLNISNFAKEIKYVPLETNNSVLLTDNIEIVYENEKTLIIDHSKFAMSSQIYLFDKMGQYSCKIGQFGQGPNDYLTSHRVSIFEDIIYIMDRNKLLIYNTEGTLMENIKLQMNVDYINQGYHRVIPLNKDFFIMTAYSMTGSCPKAFLLEKNQVDLNVIKEYTNYEPFKKAIPVLNGNESGIIYRYKDKVRIYKIYNDTIFTISQNKEISDGFIFELGKYRPTLSYLTIEEGGTDPFEWMRYGNKFIFPKTIIESNNYLFIGFDFGNHAPEPFEFKSRFSSAISINTSVYGIYNKMSGVLTLMNQPIKGKLGFKNDIDGGPVIWPNYISSDNELVSLIQPEEFMDYYDNIKQPSDVLKEIANKILLDDNPIVIIVKLKD